MLKLGHKMNCINPITVIIHSTKSFIPVDPCFVSFVLYLKASADVKISTIFGKIIAGWSEAVLLEDS